MTVVKKICNGVFRAAPGFDQICSLLNKPAAQAAGADPSRCNSTSRQNSPNQQNLRTFSTNTVILMPFNTYYLF